MAIAIGGSINGISRTSGNVVENSSTTGNVSTVPLCSSGIVAEQNQMSGQVIEPQTVYVTELYFDNKYAFPTVGDSSLLYIATDENATYRFNNSTLTYACCGRDYNEVDVIQSSLERS